MNVSIICACLPVVYGLFRLPKLHFNGSHTQLPSRKISMGSSLRRLFTSKSNSSYADVETGTESGNHVFITTERMGGDKSESDFHDTMALKPIYVQKGFNVE